MKFYHWVPTLWVMQITHLRGSLPREGPQFSKNSRKKTKIFSDLKFEISKDPIINYPKFFFDFFQATGSELSTSEKSPFLGNVFSTPR